MYWFKGDSRPKVVRRGTQQLGETITIGEPAKIDHVIFVVHGIGVTCDMRYRNIIECGQSNSFETTCDLLLSHPTSSVLQWTTSAKSRSRSSTRTSNPTKKRDAWVAVRFYRFSGTQLCVETLLAFKSKIHDFA